MAVWQARATVSRARTANSDVCQVERSHGSGTSVGLSPRKVHLVSQLCSTQTSKHACPVGRLHKVAFCHALHSTTLFSGQGAAWLKSLGTASFLVVCA